MIIILLVVALLLSLFSLALTLSLDTRGLTVGGGTTIIYHPQPEEEAGRFFMSVELP